MRDEGKLKAESWNRNERGETRDEEIERLRDQKTKRLRGEEPE